MTHMQAMEGKYEGLRKHCVGLEEQRDVIMNKYNSMQKTLNQSNYELRQEIQTIREGWKKRERELIYEREDYKNQLLDMTLLKTKLEDEVAKKDIRIKELMALILQYKEDLKELELLNTKLELSCEGFRAQIEELKDTDDINAKLKLALAAQEKENKALDIENDKLEADLKNVKASREALKKQLNNARKQLDNLQKELEAFRLHSAADYKVILVERTLGRIDQGILIAIDDTTELNQRLALLSELTPGKLPEEKAKAGAIGKDLSRDLDNVKTNGEEITKEIAPLRKELNATYDTPLKLADPKGIRAKAQTLDERISDYNDTLNMARSKRIPDFKKNLADIEETLKKELRVELAAGTRQGLGITEERDDKINGDNKSLKTLEDQTSEGMIGASGEKLETLRGVRVQLEGAFYKIQDAKTSNEISKKLLNFVEEDSEKTPESIEVLSKTRYVDLPRALQMNKETERLRSVSFDNMDELGKKVKTTLADKADELAFTLRKKFDKKGPKGLDGLQAKLSTLNLGIIDVQKQIDYNERFAKTEEQKHLWQADQNMLDIPFKKEHGELTASVPDLQAECEGLQVRVSKLSKGAPLKEITKLSDDVNAFDGKVVQAENRTDDLIERLKPVKEMMAGKGKQSEMEDRLDDELKKKDVLDKKNKALRLLASKEKPLVAGDRDLAHLDEALARTEAKLVSLEQITEPERLHEHKKGARDIVKDARATINMTKKDIVDASKKLGAIRQVVADVEPERLGAARANDILNKAGEDLKKLEPELNKVDQEVVKSKEQEAQAKTEVDNLEQALKDSLTGEINAGLAEN